MRPEPRVTRQRVRQVETWLRAEFPFRGRVLLSFDGVCPNSEHGHCDRLPDGSYTIRLHPRSVIKLETLLHEWAHLGRRRMNHGPAWGRRYQPITQKWYDHGGAEASRLL